MLNVSYCALGCGVPTRRQSLTGDIEGISPKSAVLTEHILGIFYFYIEIICIEIAKSNAKKMESIKMHTRRLILSTVPFWIIELQRRCEHKGRRTAS